MSEERKPLTAPLIDAPHVLPPADVGGKPDPTPPACPDVAVAAKQYIASGVAVVRLKRSEKLPTDRAWTTRSAAPEDFRIGDNVGLVCGWPSTGGVPGRCLVCVDLDSADAISKADLHLPPTDAIEGRPAKPRSHRWYFVTDIPMSATSTAAQAAAAAQAAGTHPGPAKRSFKHAATKQNILDFIGTGGQTVVPPSRHDSGEARAWEPENGIEHAAVVPFETLWSAVCKLAEVCGAKVPPTPVASRTSKAAGPMGSADMPRVKRGDESSAERPGRVQGTRTRIDTPMDQRVAKCRDCLKTVDLARSGCGGHDTTYCVARIIVNDFAVTDRDVALGLLREYNGRLKKAGEEEWSEDELRHKIDSALAAPPTPDHRFGSRLLTPRGWDDPKRLADEFLTEHTLVVVKDTVFVYDRRGYRVVSRDWLESQVRLFADRRAEAEFRRRVAEADADAAQLQAAHVSLAAALLPVDDPDEFTQKREKSLRKAIEQAEKKRPKAAPAVKPALVAATVQAVVAEVRLDDGTELDTWLPPGGGPAVLAVANGLLDPVTRTLLPLTAAWFTTTSLPVQYDRDAPPPEKWLQFLAEVTDGDGERMAVLQELFGACLDRYAPGKWFAMLVGSGDNGKSVVLHVLKLLLGERNVASVGLGELSANRFAAFQLFGKLANVVGDEGKLESAEEGRLKTLTGGDLTTFEQKGRDPFSAVNRAKLVFACNTPPTFGDKSEAVWNRLVAIPFTYTVPAGKKNPAMLTDGFWAEDLSGILNWALDGLARFRSNGGRFTKSASCDVLKREHRQDSNPARRYLLEEYEWTSKEADHVPVAELYSGYKLWCEEQGYKSKLTGPRFAKEVDSAFPGIAPAKTVRRRETSVRCRVGLKRRDGQ